MAKLASLAEKLIPDNFIQRVIMCAIMLPLFVLAIWESYWGFPIILWCIALLGAREWLRMTLGKILSPKGYVFFICIIAVAVTNQVYGSHPAWALIAVIFAGLLAGTVRQNAVRATWYAGGFLYFTVPTLSLLAMFDNNTIGPAIMTYFFATIWAADIGAYLVGRRIGGAKLAPGISPKKTWSGFIGGMITSIIVGIVIYAYLNESAQDIVWAGFLALIISVAGQMSDLLESWIKRRHSVKDTGTMIMGHGGVLDRIDSLILSAPLFAFIQFCVGHPIPW